MRYDGVCGMAVGVLMRLIAVDCVRYRIMRLPANGRHTDVFANIEPQPSLLTRTLTTGVAVSFGLRLFEYESYHASND